MKLWIATQFFLACIIIQLSRGQATFSSNTDFVTESNPENVSFTDINGDGKLDMIVGNDSFNAVSVYLNTTTPGAVTPTFSSRTNFTTSEVSHSFAVVDINSDGSPDLVVGRYNTNFVSVFLNTTAAGASTPTFSSKTDFTTGTTPWFIACGDLNGDGVPDLAVTNNGANTVSVFLNTTTAGASTPSFSAKTDFTTGLGPTALSIADINGDGKPDIVVVDNSNNSVSVLLNTTTPGASTPTFSAKTDFVTGAFGSGASFVAIGDLNGDGKPDLGIVNYVVDSLVILMNTTTPGASTPAFSTTYRFHTGISPKYVAIADINGDGKPDAVVTNDVSNSFSIFLNTTSPGAASPSFSTSQDIGTGSVPLGAAVGDINGDGKADIAEVNNFSTNVSVFLNTTAIGVTAPAFGAKTDFPAGTDTWSVAIRDFNGDGKPDLAAANYTDNTVSILLNTTAPGASTPAFSAKTDFSTGTTPYSVATGDFNGDGKQDVAVANYGSNSVSVLLNTTTAGASTPTFSAKTNFTTGTNPYSVAVGDLNRDGKLDLAVPNFSSNTVSVFINTTTTGASTCSMHAKVDFTTGTGPISVAIGDFNGDGNPDLAVVNYNSSTVSVLLNTTSPNFVTQTFSAKADFPTGLNPMSVAVGDFNGDGLLDLAVANNGANSVSVLLNTTAPGASTPSFSAKSDFTTGSGPIFLSIGDLTGDGKHDIAVANNVSNSVSLFRNTTTPGAATPTFSAKSDFTTGNSPRSVCIGNLNGDGKPDLATANNADNAVAVLLNGAVLPLPVELTSFSASVIEHSVGLFWGTATEVNNYGFEIERAVMNYELEIRNWQQVGFVEGSGASNTMKSYSFTDRNLSGGIYSYRLKQIDRNGQSAFSTSVQVEISLPRVLMLSESYPNPFNPSTTIEFTVPEDGKASLKIYDILGREVTTLVNGNVKAGEIQHATFDAKNLASGVYFSRLEYGEKQLTRKLLLSK